MSRSGTEVAIRDFALALARRGHTPIVYAPNLGKPAAELRARGIAVTDNLLGLKERPDIIHGQHNVPTVEAMVAFPDTPAIWMCHDFDSWHDEPPLFPQIRRYIAVDAACRDRLVHIDGVEPHLVSVLYNAVDLSRIPPRERALPLRPRSAVAFTKTKREIPLLQEACDRSGIPFTAFGRGLGNMTAEPERELVKHDLVFATARGAIEALCAGSSVILCDGRGLGKLVTTANLDSLRDANFGRRCLTREVTVDRVLAEIQRYKAADAAAVCERMRADADLEKAIDTLEQTYRQCIDEHLAAQPDSEANRLALMKFLHDWLPKAPDNRWAWSSERQSLVDHCEQLDAECEGYREEIRLLKLQQGKSPAPEAAEELATSIRDGTSG